MLARKLSKSSEDGKNLHTFLLEQLKSYQTEINEIFDVLRKRINDIFQNVEENSSDFVHWAETYIAKMRETQKEPTQKNLRSLTDIYKLVDELKDTFGFIPSATMDDFLNKLNFWSNNMRNMSSILENAYVKKRERFTDLYLEKEYDNHGLKSSLSRASTLCGNVGAFSFDPTEGRRAPLLLCYPRQDKIIGNYHNSIDSHPIQSIEWIEKNKAFVSASAQNLKFFLLDGVSKIRCLKSFKRPQGGNLVYIPREDYLISAGKNPHCRIFRTNSSRSKAIFSINLASKIEDRCLGVAYINSHDILVLAFSQSLQIYDMRSKKFTQEINLSSDFITMKYISGRGTLVVGVANYKLELFKFSGSGKLSLDKRVETKGNKPCSIITNSEENQLLIASNENILETYEFDDRKTQDLALKLKVKVNNLLYFKENKKIIGLGDGNYLLTFGTK